MMSTPPSSRHYRTNSPPLSSSGSSSAFQPKLNVVTRLALEGKTKHGWDGAAIKIYLKISLPMDTVTPGSSIPLFPEENVKIFDSQVHPIDNSSAPYLFSSTTCPLLNRAARALNLPARSSQSYLSLFTASSSIAASSRHSSPPTNGTNVPPLDEKYTGSILVSGYNVSFVLPKEFPPRFKGAEIETNAFSARSITPSASFNKRRNSIGEKNILQFMAVIDMWVPYLSSPPKAPYLLSIPIPRCLSNHIKLRIFPPTTNTTSGSYASLSSAEEDISSWDLTSDPHVTRSSSSRLSRSTSYMDFADDESSDSANTGGPGFGDGCGVQGTFPSAERIRVRWAAPLKPEEVPEASDGRRRVGLRDVKGDMSCVVLGKKNGGVVLKLEYKGTCKGVWFPGVATLLGMDVGLDAPHCQVSWVPGMDSKWSVNGSTGFTGFAVGPPFPTVSRRPSIIEPLQANGPGSTSRFDSYSKASLLRAPLPAQNITECSFEDSVSTLATGTMSSLGSLGARSRSSSVNGPDRGVDTTPRPPTIPITLHLNMNDLLPPSNIFTFSISGSVLVTPHPKKSRELSMDSDDDSEEQPLLLPKFRLIYTESETISTIVRSEIDDSIVEVYGSGNIRDASGRKTTLHKGEVAKCGTENAHIILRPLAVTAPGRIRRGNPDINVSRTSSPPSRPRTPSGPSLTRYVSNSAMRLMASTIKPKRDGPLMIPSVMAIVTPLIVDEADLPNAYAVKISLPAPSDADSEWLEFGLAHPGDTDRPPQVEVASASLEGVPVRFETTAAVKHEKISESYSIPFDQMSGKEWVSWVRIHVGDLGGGQVEVVYLTKTQSRGTVRGDDKKGKKKASYGTDFDVLLPTFSLPVGRLEVNIEFQFGYEISVLRSNLSHQQILPHCRKLLHYSMEELFYPRLTITITPLLGQAVKIDHGMLSNSIRVITWTAPAMLAVVLLCLVITLTTQLRQTKGTLQTCLTEANSNEVTVTVTVTSMTPLPPLQSSRTGSLLNRWYTADQPTISPASPLLKPPEPPNTINHASGASHVSTPTPTSAPTPTTSQNNALLPLSDVLRRTFHFDIPPKRVIAQQVRHGLSILWQVLRKVYHYPLDPP